MPTQTAAIIKRISERRARLDRRAAALPGEYYEISFYLDNNGCSVSDNPGCGAYYN